ncbi:MAG: hypothetical protein K6G45_11905 [Lachnospiraceae bacterium]|nr:hypothetical protein [Lachnospiraceae bacterium]
MRDLFSVIKCFSHICWYPSAGADFRAMLYLSDAYYDSHSKHPFNPYPADAPRITPDLFIMTDIDPYQGCWYRENEYSKIESELTNLLEGKPADILYTPWSINRTKSWLTDHAKDYQKAIDYPDTLISVNGYPERLSADYPAFLINVEIYTSYMGVRYKWSSRLIYLAADNCAVLQDLVKNDIRIETQIKIRADHGILYDVKKSISDLQTEYFIAEKRYTGKAVEFYRIPGRCWSGSDDILFCSLKD